MIIMFTTASLPLKQFVYLIESLMYVAKGTYFMNTAATFDKRAGYTAGIFIIVGLFLYFDN